MLFKKPDAAIQKPRYFSLDEFKCKGGSCCGGDYVVHLRLLEMLDEIRMKFGDPLRVNSGYRCQAHNKNVGGSKFSQHVYGRAADITPFGYSVQNFAKLVRIAEAMDPPGLGIYARGGQSFIHVDVRSAAVSARWGDIDREDATFAAAMDRAISGQATA